MDVRLNCTPLIQGIAPLGGFSLCRFSRWLRTNYTPSELYYTDLCIASMSRMFLAQLEGLEWTLKEESFYLLQALNNAPMAAVVACTH